MTNCNKCLIKKSSNYYESIKPQKIITELNNGELLPDDYYGRSYEVLQNMFNDNNNTTNTSNIHIPSKSDIENDHILQLYELHHILDSNMNHLEHGFCRLNDGSWYLAVTTPLDNVSGEMFEWWFNHCDSTERFMWWHPTCNGHGEYDPTFYAVQPEDSKFLLLLLMMMIMLLLLFRVNRTCNRSSFYMY